MKNKAEKSPAAFLILTAGDFSFIWEVFCAVRWGISDSLYIKIREIVHSVNVLTPE